jgi:hypothetical protein
VLAGVRPMLAPSRTPDGGATTAVVSNPMGAAIFVVALVMVLGACPVLWLYERKNR